MEAQLHRTHGHEYDEHLHPTDIHGEEERGGETRSAMQKVKQKVDKLKATIKHGHGSHHKDEEETMNDSHAVRSGLAEPTVMGTPVLAEDLYATHSDIVDPPVRSFAQWEDEQRHGASPPLSTDYETHLTGHHTHGQDVNREQFKGSIGKHTFEEEDRYGAPPPVSTGYETKLTHLPQVGQHTYGQDVNMEQLKGGNGKPTGLEEEEDRHGASQLQSDRIYRTQHAYGDDDANVNQRMGIGKSTAMEEATYPSDTVVFSPNLQSEVTDTTNTGRKEVGITDVLRSFDKMKVYDEPEPKSLESDQNEPEVYTGSHDQFAPEPVENPPAATGSELPSNQSSSYTQKISSATSAIAHKAAEVKDSIVSKLSSENKTESKPNKRSSFPTEFSHKVADTLSSTLGPVYEKVAEAGNSVTSKMQGAGHDDMTGRPKAITVREYLADTFKPRDDDKVLSEVITHAFNRGKGNVTPQETSTTTTTTYLVRDEVVRDEGERRLQDSGN